MKVYKRKKPRTFLVSEKNRIFLKDVGKVSLNDNENLTISSTDKKNYEICRKNWGYYATPSINVRLKKNGFRTVLVKQNKKLFILIVDNKKIKMFKRYIKLENYKIVKRLDNLKFTT